MNNKTTRFSIHGVDVKLFAELSAAAKAAGMSLSSYCLDALVRAHIERGEKIRYLHGGTPRLYLPDDEPVPEPVPVVKVVEAARDVLDAGLLAKTEAQSDALDRLAEAFADSAGSDGL
jgi:hypothetical protein